MSARPSPSQAALRRLELLSAELAEVRPSVPERGLEEGDTVELEAVAPVLPLPGRHAARPPAPAPAPRWRLPEGLALRPVHLAVLALIVAGGVLLAAWWVVRSGGSMAVPAAGPVTASVSPVAGLATPGASSSPTASSEVVVDVTGRVRRPGIVVLQLGDRVVDALRAAGGPLRGTDLSTLNQARLLVDGEQIVVGGAPVPGVAASASAASAPAAPLVNLNTATQAELESLPGIGPVTAQSILEWREANGRFTSVEELLEVDGIGDATLADIAPYVTL
jgi:competence protein ComEA